MFLNDVSDIDEDLLKLVANINWQKSDLQNKHNRFKSKEW